MRAPRTGGVHRHSAEGTVLLRLLGLDENLRDAPRHKPNNQEIYRGGKKITDAELDRPDIPGRLLPLSPGSNEENERHDEVVDQCFDKCVEGSCDDDGDGKCNDILFQQEFPELLQHGLIPVKVRRKATGRWRDAEAILVAQPIYELLRFQRGDRVPGLRSPSANRPTGQSAERAASAASSTGIRGRFERS